MSLGIEHLSESITPQTTGILWLTDTDLEINTPGVYEFNYLLNGILVKNLTEKMTKSHHGTSFYLGDNFGKPLFIGHVVISTKTDVEKMYTHLEVAKSLISDDSHVYIFNRSKNTANINILKSLSEKFKDLEFRNLNI